MDQNKALAEKIAATVADIITGGDTADAWKTPTGEFASAVVIRHPYKGGSDDFTMTEYDVAVSTLVDERRDDMVEAIAEILDTEIED